MKLDKPPSPPPSPKGGSLQTKIERSYGFGDQIHYIDTPMKRIYRELSRDWQPMMIGHQPPDFKMMREVAFSEHDTTSFPTTTRFQYDKVDPPSGLGHKHDSPDTAHYVGGVLKNISPELYALYHGGSSNSQPQQKYKTRVPRSNVVSFDRYDVQDIHGRNTKW